MRPHPSHFLYMLLILNAPLQRMVDRESLVRTARVSSISSNINSINISVTRTLESQKALLHPP